MRIVFHKMSKIVVLILAMGALGGLHLRGQSGVRVTYALVALSEDLWPEKVKVLEELEVQLIFNGREIGHTVLEKGKEMTLKKIDKEHLILDFKPAEVRVPYEKTDLMERAEALYISADKKKEKSQVEKSELKSIEVAKVDLQNKEAQNVDKGEGEDVEEAELDREEEVEGGFRNKLLRGCKAKFVKVDGNRVRAYALEEMAKKEYLAIYFSASWCGPCRKFTPQVVEMYNGLSEKQREKFELIFICLDKGQEAMNDYMIKYKMPWPGVRKDDVGDAKKESFSNFASGSIPNLVLVDQRGKLVESGSYTDVLRKIPLYLK